MSGQHILVRKAGTSRKERELSPSSYWDAVKQGDIAPDDLVCAPFVLDGGWQRAADHPRFVELAPTPKEAQDVPAGNKLLAGAAALTALYVAIVGAGLLKAAQAGEGETQAALLVQIPMYLAGAISVGFFSRAGKLGQTLAKLWAPAAGALALVMLGVHLATRGTSHLGTVGLLLFILAHLVVTARISYETWRRESGEDLPGLCVLSLPVAFALGGLFAQVRSVGEGVAIALLVSLAPFVVGFGFITSKDPSRKDSFASYLGADAA